LTGAGTNLQDPASLIQVCQGHEVVDQTLRITRSRSVIELRYLIERFSSTNVAVSAHRTLSVLIRSKPCGAKKFPELPR